MPPKPAQKPTLADKLVLWRQAHGMVLEEMEASMAPYVIDADNKTRLIADAARTAAILIQGVSDGRDPS